LAKTRCPGGCPEEVPQGRGTAQHIHRRLRKRGLLVTLKISGNSTNAFDERELSDV